MHFLSPPHYKAHPLPVLLIRSSIALSITKSDSHQNELAVKCNMAFGITLVMNTVFNVVLTLSIGKSVFRPNSMLSDYVERYYNQTVTIILESGIIYPIFIIIHLIVYSCHETVAYNIYSLLIQATGIAPMLIVVCAALGISVQQHSIEVASSFRAAEAGSLFQIGAPVVIDVNVEDEANKAHTSEMRVKKRMNRVSVKKRMETE
ncbi:hypothetical protein Moror_9560 [Moniliophthora roreri MCA 2997]|uniref:Uncharacterized protein n=1 Tax=Moniliophthora roreri (strain MCA 2997) TaxID=1381753 RepID=V2XBQ6_MONRO|nr:hypothetical protein Moror_9560 [Moniliophthora roreri MCA 2997]